MVASERQLWCMVMSTALGAGGSGTQSLLLLLFSVWRLGKVLSEKG